MMLIRVVLRTVILSSGIEVIAHGVNESGWLVVAGGVFIGIYVGSSPRD